LSTPRLSIESVTVDPALSAHEGLGPAWLRALDDKSIAAMPAAGGVVRVMEWEDLCAAIVPLLEGSDAAFTERQEVELPRALEKLEASLAQVQADVRAGTASAAQDQAAAAMVECAAAAAECAMRVLVGRVANRPATELAPIAKRLETLPMVYRSGPASSLANDRAADKLAPRAVAVAAIAAYLAHAPLGAGAKGREWLGVRLERGEWKWFESALAPLTMAAVAARAVAAGCKWRGPFSVTSWATRGRVTSA
jgi:hypothetical protein